GLTDVLQFRLQPFGIPPQLLRMLPYFFTLFSMVSISLFTLSKRMKKFIKAPEALGIPYIRGEKK
ncbi:MAG: ABC transporter permease, partial [Promethearchaeota archaeon]